MKVLLINPPRTYRQGSKGVRLGLPLGLMYIAANLEKNSIPVKILDSLISSETKIIEHQGHIYHGVADDLLKNIINEEKPDIVGIGNPFTAQIENTIKVAGLVKQADPNVFIVVGGPHFAVSGKQFLKENENIDFAVAGEGEKVMPELIEALEDKKPFDNINGLIFRQKVPGKQTEIMANTPEFIKELDSLPLPAYHLVDMECYFHFLEQGLSARPNKYERSVSMITSRGCPYNCVFCSVHLHMGKVWRAHSEDHVASHIQYLVDNYKVKHISFEDDNFAFNFKRCENIIGQMIKKKININWDTPNGVRADTLNENLLIKMKKSGCRGLIIAAESGDQDTLDNIINKNLKLESVIRVAGWCKKLKIRLESFFVIGFPGETKAKIQKTIDFAIWLYKKFNVRPNLTIATPLLGTRLYEIAAGKKYLAEKITPENLAVATQAYGRGMIKTSEFNPQDLKKFARQLNSRLARLDLIKKIMKPRQYFKALGIAFTKPGRLILYLKKIKG